MRAQTSTSTSEIKQQTIAKGLDLYDHYFKKYEHFRDLKDYPKQKLMLDSMQFYIENLSDLPDEELLFRRVNHHLYQGVYYRDIGDIEKAIDQQEIVISQIEDPKSASQKNYETYHYALHQLSDLNNRKSNYHRAIQYLDFSIRLEEADANLDKRVSLTSSMECRKAELLENIGEDGQAKALYRVAIDKFLKRIERAPPSELDPYRYHFIGYIRKEVDFCLEQNDLERAEKLLNAIADIEIEDHVNNHFTHLLWATYFTKKGDLEKGGQYFEKARIEIFDGPENHFEKLKYYLSIAGAQISANHLEEATSSMGQAEIMADSIMEYSATWSKDIILTKTKKIELLNHLDRHEEVLEELAHFIDEIDERLSGAIIFEDHINFVHSFYPVFEIGLSIINTHLPERVDLAFRILECVKSLSLYKSSLLTQTSASIAQDSLIYEYKKLTTIVSNYKIRNARISLTDDLKNQYYLANEELEKVKREILDLADTLVSANLADYQKTLRNNQNHVLTFSGKEHYFLLSVSSRIAALHQLEKVSLDSLLRKFLTNISTYKDNKYIEQGKQIFELLEPAMQSETYRTILFSGDGLLGQIPIEALITSKGNFLIKKLDIAYTPSARIQMLLRNGSKEHLNMAIFRPTFKDDDIPLDFAVKESEAIKELMNASLFTDELANKDSFINECEKYDLLHIATHAKGIENAPSLSTIKFTNSFLNFDEIRELVLDAEMVFLSACETNTGKVYEGEGIQSLSRNFIASGARSIVSSLWAIPDQTTSEITIHFYQNLKKGYTKSEALQMAKLDFIEENQDEGNHPYFWAGLVLTGNEDAIFNSVPNWMSVLGMAVVILALLAMIVLKFRRTGI